MLRIQVQNVAARARKYFVDGLASDDYYQAGTELPGQWFGAGAERLGLHGPVRYDDFAALTENTQPATGERLTPRKDDDRRVGYDLNFHAPKSVSLAYFLTGDEAIREAFIASVRETMADIEAEMSTRVRRGGANHDRSTGNLIGAEYIHFTARPVDGIADPHLHAHCFVFNATWDETESRWKAGQFGDIVRHAQYHQDAFHSRFSQRLGDLGYRISPREFAFELGDVPDGLIERFSRRTELIETLAEEMGIADAAQKAGLGAKTRERKRDDITLSQLRENWVQRLTPEDRAWLTSIREARQDGQSFRETPESPEPELEDDLAELDTDEAFGPDAWDTEPEPDRRATSDTYEQARVEPSDDGRAQQQSQQQRAWSGDERTQHGHGTDRGQRNGQSQQKQRRQASDTGDSKDRTRGQESKAEDTRMGASSAEEQAEFTSSRRHKTERPSYDARRAIKIAIKHLMDRESLVEEYRVIRYAMRHSRGRATPEELWQALKERTDIPRKTIKGKSYLTTKQATREERRMIQFAVDGIRRHRRLGGPPLHLSALKLTAYDMEVMRELLSSRDRVTLLKMSGASYRPAVVKATLEGIRQDMHGVVVIAANAAASRQAEELYGLEAVPTLAKFLSEPKLWKVVRGQLLEHVIWVEQAGRIGTRDMLKLFNLARKMGARLVLSGDDKGLKASQRGDAFEILRKLGKLRTVDWKVNHNMQGDFWDAKESLRAKAKYTGEEFVRNEMFRRTKPGTFLHDEVAKRYVEVVKKNHSAVLVGATAKMVTWLNRAVRSQLRAKGKLKDGDISVLQLKPVFMSPTEKGMSSSYRRGMVIEFHRNAFGFKAGDRTKVVGVKAGVVWVRPRIFFGMMQPVVLPLPQSGRFSVYEPTRTSVAIGDRIELTRNVKPIIGKPLRNRSLRTIIGIVPGTRQLILDNGRILDRRFGHFRHAYATNAHGLQGRNVDSVFFAAESYEWGKVTNEHLSTAAEAAKKRFEVWTDGNVEAFQRAVERDEPRMSTTDFHERAEDINEEFQREQEEKQFDEEMDRKARARDRWASGRHKEYWDEAEAFEREEEQMARDRQREAERQQQQQQQSGGPSHGF
jgi:conjugative relaxase-like TrwC/TraI family protein